MPGDQRTVLALESLLAEHGPAYLVGSANWGQTLAPPDHDYAVAGDPLAIGRSVTGALGGRFVVLDRDRRHVRLVLPRARPADLAPLVGGSITEDLALRDFTVNAIAATLPGRRPLLDPFRGRTDLRYRVLRRVSAGCMAADPLRVLRGVRLASEHGFVIEPETLSSMAEAAHKLRGVQPERIRLELVRALSAPGRRRAAELLLEMNVWPSLPVEPPLRPEPAAYRAYLDNLEALGAKVVASPLCRRQRRDALAPERAGGLAVVAAALVAAGVPPDRCQGVAARLRFARQEADLLSRICAAAAWVEGDAYSLYQRYGCAAHWAAALLGHRQRLAELLAIEPVPPGLIPPGGDLAGAFGRTPGPWLGELLRALERAVALGRAGSREEVLALAEQWVRQHPIVDEAGD